MTTRLRLRIEVSGVVALRLVLPAPDQRVELDGATAQDLDLARRRGEHARAARAAQRLDVTGDEEHRVHLLELVPRQAVVAPRADAASDRRS